MISLRILAIALAAAGLSAPSLAQTVISSVPFTIIASGKYVVGGNLITASSAQVAITINAPNVILDLNQFFVSGPGSTPASQIAVISVANVSNVTIRNGTVANNGYGIRFASGANCLNHLVENVNATRCYICGIYVSGDSPGTIVRNNTITQTGGSTSQTGTVAIGVVGGTRVENNTIHTVSASGSSIGITAASSDLILRNTVVNASIGVYGGKYRDNTFFNCATPFILGTDAGGNS